MTASEGRGITRAELAQGWTPLDQLRLWSLEDATKAAEARYAARRHAEAFPDQDLPMSWQAWRDATPAPTPPARPGDGQVFLWACIVVALVIVGAEFLVALL